ncbi:hypothetical protein [Yoonia sp. 2307UL14-13]|uniref:hypothetical protein n=1 Tax=Yoonia sp. 2307UL14-13 TaxID=3126506 RepID=UPI0030A9D5A2
MTNAKAILTTILTLTFVLSPIVTDPFSGFRADQLPNPQIEPPVQPAGYAFTIWGLIYAWLVISAGFGLWKRADADDWNRARLPLIISLAVGTPWLAVANASAVWATILIFVMAAGAIAALIRSPMRDEWFFRVPVGIYAGWLTAASFVSLGSTAAGYSLLTDQIGWAYLGISGALVIGLYVTYLTNTLAYALTIVWALVAIIVANGADPWTVSALAAVGIVALLAFAVPRKAVSAKVPS